MSNIRRPLETSVDTRGHTNGLPAKVPPFSGAISDQEHQQLQRHLRQCETGRRPSTPLITALLKRKIFGARVLDTVQASDAVTGGSVVAYTIDGGPERSGLLVHRARPGVGGGVIPVSSVLGATLIGMRAGEEAPLLCEDGTTATLRVEHVSATA